MTAPHTAPMGEQELTSLAEELREYTAMKYAGDCKCGKCQLVPRALVDRLYSALRAAASPRLAGREEIARIIDPGAGWDRLSTFTRLEEQKSARAKADAILSLLGPAPSWRDIESAPKDRKIFAIRAEWWTPDNGNHRWIFTPIRESEWDAERQRWSFGVFKQPTHWMPVAEPPALPAPPTSHASQDRPADENTEGK